MQQRRWLVQVLLGGQGIVKASPRSFYNVEYKNLVNNLYLGNLNAMKPSHYKDEKKAGVDVTDQFRMDWTPLGFASKIFCEPVFFQRGKLETRTQLFFQTLKRYHLFVSDSKGQKVFPHTLTHSVD
ncbi:hypothetical protein YC2023_097463 [Brassica napus]